MIQGNGSTETYSSSGPLGWMAMEAARHSVDGVAFELSGHPLRPVVADDADDVAAREPELDQAEREVAHPGLIVVPGEQAPETEVLFAQRDVAAMLARVEAQQF